MTANEADMDIAEVMALCDSFGKRKRAVVIIWESMREDSKTHTQICTNITDGALLRRYLESVMKCNLSEGKQISGEVQA